MRKTLVAIMLMALTTLGLPGAQAQVTATSAAVASPGTVVAQEHVGNTFAGAAVEFDIVTQGGRQYIAYFDNNRNIIVKHRTVGATDGAWSTKTILESSYNPDQSGRNHSFKNNWDSHNWLRIAVDQSGNLHVIGDMHNAGIRYWRTTTPGSLSTLTAKGQGDFPSSVTIDATYPEFILNPGGNLKWLMLRSGGSGNGDTLIFEWNNSGKFWHAPDDSGPSYIEGGSKTLFDNVSSDFADGTGSAYTETFYTLDGWYHIVYNWRENGNADSNTQLAYLKTQDWVNFYNINGVQRTTPIKAHTTGVNIDDIAGGDVNFINNEYQFAKVGSTTVVAYPRTIGGKKQLRAAVHTGSGGWNIQQITNEANGVGPVGNMFPENYVTIIDGDTVAFDHNYSANLGRFTRRTTFDLPNVNNGPFPSAPAPTYYPASVYQAVDSFTVCGDFPPHGDGKYECKPGTSHTKADSRSMVQVETGNRYYIDSRPKDSNTLYVLSWVSGPETHGPPQPLPDTSTYPIRKLYIYKVTY